MSKAATTLHGPTAGTRTPVASDDNNLAMSVLILCGCFPLRANSRVGRLATDSSSWSPLLALCTKDLQLLLSREKQYDRERGKMATRRVGLILQFNTHLLDMRCVQRRKEGV